MSHQAAAKGFPEITEEYCLKKCDSVQKGLKAECPDSVRFPLGKKGREQESNNSTA